MDESIARNVHWSFWVIGAAALIWHVMGCMNFLMQLSPDNVAAMPDSHRAIVEGRPMWATAGFAVGVFGGAIGSLLLLLRKFASFHVFVASLVGIIITSIHTVRVAATEASLSPFEVVMMILMSPIVAALMIWYSRRCKNHEWLA